MNFKYYKTEKLILFLIALTIFFGALSTLIEHILSSQQGTLKTIILFTDSLTVPFFITLTIYLINSFWWKTKLFKWLIDIPNLNGRYVGKLTSSFIENGQPKIMDCVIEIKQSASSIHISAYFGNLETNDFSSSSGSAAEEIVKERNGFFTLYYVFTNESGGLRDRLNNHSGTAKLQYYPDNMCLEGSYYNVIKNTGSIRVFFSQSTLLGRFAE